MKASFFRLSDYQIFRFFFIFCYFTHFRIQGSAGAGRWDHSERALTRPHLYGTQTPTKERARTRTRTPGGPPAGAMISLRRHTTRPEFVRG